jgi:uncharacterized protein (DUF885 family)
MTDLLDDLVLPRPASAPDRGPLDDPFYDLVEGRVRRILSRDPIVATYLGIHALDDRLPDASRDAVLQELADERAHEAAIEAIDPAVLSAPVRFERDLELHVVRRSIFELDVARRWERGSHAIDELGDALFLLFAREFAPLAERLDSIAGRLEAAPAFLAGHRTRATVPQVKLWQFVEGRSAAGLPSLLDEIQAAAEGTLHGAPLTRLRRAGEAARASISNYAEWLAGTFPDGTETWALGRERFDALIGLRALDGLDSDAILEIGWRQLAANHAARAEAAREIDPRASEAEVVDRLKDDHPATFEAALETYRSDMTRARQHVIEHEIATVPADERLLVTPTPMYLRAVMPFAAYFAAPPFERQPVGLYIVTPSVDGDPAAMREHYRASISNTCVHEAYPGHHLQLSVAARNPSLTRLQVHATEFIEGWGMYCEQMMREEGFDAGPTFRVAVATDAIWRACRIILDVRMHRGELSVDEATDFLVEHTAFERPNARAEVVRYTASPTQPLSYLLGKVLILGLREDERRRLGAAFSLRAFHDTLLGNGSLPISFHRRLLADAASAG